MFCSFFSETVWTTTELTLKVIAKWAFRMKTFNLPPSRLPRIHTIEQYSYKHTCVDENNRFTKNLPTARHTTVKIISQTFVFFIGYYPIGVFFIYWRSVFRNITLAQWTTCDINGTALMFPITKNNMRWIFEFSERLRSLHVHLRDFIMNSTWRRQTQQIFRRKYFSGNSQWWRYLICVFFDLQFISAFCDDDVYLFSMDNI